MLNLWPINNGCLYYVGLDVLPPFVVHGAERLSAAEKAAVLDAYAARLGSLSTDAPFAFHSLDEYGEDWRLKPGIVARTAMQRLGSR